MYFNLALKNLKRSIKDYTIYFLTLIFGVCIFYTFNSIESQKVMMDLSKEYENAFASISEIMNIASTFISFILGFLIVYANNYLINRRKKEFGIYMILGMEKNNLSRMIFLETLLVGLISLGLGLIIGVFLSQGLSVLTAKMFNVNLMYFKFIFSMSACIKTILCFGLIYLILLLFNSFSIRKVKLIDLLGAAKRNQMLKLRNVTLSIILFIMSVLMISGAYYKVLNDKLAVVGNNMIQAVLLGSIGTFLFFFSLAGIMLKLIQANKKKYFKDLNMFIFKQINSKINTTFLSMTFICLMLFLAICMLSGGLSIGNGLNKNIKELTQFDVAFLNTKGEDINEILSNKGIDLSKYSDEYASYTLYYNKFGYKDFLNKYLTEEDNSYYKIYANEDIPIIKVSEFNKTMKILNKEIITLNEDQYAIFTDDSHIKKLLEKSVKDNTYINVNNHKLTLAEMNVLEVVTYNDIIKNNLGIFIVNDSLLEGAPSAKTFLNLNFRKNSGDAENQLSEAINKLDRATKNSINYRTRNELLAQSVGFGVMFSYLSIYLGTIFLITSAAVLALQQLCECDDNIERYKLLRKIGVDEYMINKSLLIQVGIYFIIPLVLAIVHSIVGIKLASQLVIQILGTGIIGNILLTAIMLIIIYGGYFISTYFGTKKIIKQYI